MEVLELTFLQSEEQVVENEEVGISSFSEEIVIVEGLDLALESDELQLVV